MKASVSERMHHVFHPAYSGFNILSKSIKIRVSWRVLRPYSGPQAFLLTR